MKTLTEILSHYKMFSMYQNIFHGRIYHDVREKYNCSQTEKQKKHPVYEDKSDSRRKVVIVRRTLI